VWTESQSLALRQNGSDTPSMPLLRWLERERLAF
jgi:hypothetical protein